MCVKNYIRNTGTCTFENGKYTGGIIDDKTIKATKSVPTKTVQEKSYSNKF